jgi:DNA-binding MarR family transcriptional regulator
MSVATAADKVLYEQLIVLMMRAKRHMAIACTDYNMTPIQGIFLTLVKPGCECSMNEVAEIMGCDASNITGIVDRLESQDLIKRRACDKDRRIKMICLSKKGESCRQDILDELQKSEAIDMRNLNSEEVAELSRILAKLST